MFNTVAPQLLVQAGLRGGADLGAGWTGLAHAVAVDSELGAEAVAAGRTHLGPTLG